MTEETVNSDDFKKGMMIAAGAIAVFVSVRIVRNLVYLASRPANRW